VKITDFAIENKVVTYFIVFLLVAGGVGSFFSLGQLEDPEFTVKVAVIITPYPGASPQEVELEVTDRIETKIQELIQIKKIQSFSRAGLSLIKVTIQDEYWSDRLPQVWDELRKKVRDMSSTLPPGAGKPQLFDDFGDVYGMFFAVTGEGFNYSELEGQVKDLRKELLLVDGVGKIQLWGIQEKMIYLDISESQLSTLGFVPEDLLATLAFQNKVVDAGKIDIQNRRIRVAPTGAFRKPEDIGNLKIVSSALNTFFSIPPHLRSDQNSLRKGEGRLSLMRIKDIATVRRGYLEPSHWMMRYNGKPALGIALAPLPGSNVVKVGEAVEKRMRELMGSIPVGIDIDRIAFQPDLVKTAVGDFMINLAEAVLIVLVCLAIPMGIRMGLIIGSGLILTILSSFVVMNVMGIDLQRMSLGALVIALGMMVDNSIVVADGYLVRVQSGMDPQKAANESASLPAMPLLGATIIAVMAFYPIFGTTTEAGEYCRTLFLVVGISLLFSWLIAMMITPVQCMDMLGAPKKLAKEKDMFDSPFFRIYKDLLEWCIRHRRFTIAAMVGLLAVSIWGFGSVDRTFFTDSTRQQFMIDYWAPEGTRIQNVSNNLKRIEQRLLKDKRVLNVNTFIGQGAARFYIPIDPEFPYESYAQLIVNTHTLEGVNELVAEYEPWLNDNVPEALTRVTKYPAGPYNTWKFEARFIGPANADPKVLLDLARQGVEILEQTPLAKHARIDWRQPVNKIRAKYNEARGRRSGVTRLDVAQAFKRSFDGTPVGMYREGDDLIPIVVRYPDEDRKQVPSHLNELQIWPSLSSTTVPMSQVMDKINLQWEQPLIWRYNRRRTVTVQATPNGVTFPALHDVVREKFENIKMPPGYSLMWDGEFKSTNDAQDGLKPGAVPAVVVMLFLIVLLFNNLRQPLVILLVIPFALIGITVGLILFDQPFSFMALLGALSLVGMMIKNSIVLLDEVNIQIEGGKNQYDAMINSGMSRLRPVLLAAATTVLGVLPLLQDVFWIAMATTIIAGLTFGTLITMIFVPVLYCTFYNVSSPAKAS